MANQQKTESETIKKTLTATHTPNEWYGVISRDVVLQRVTRSRMKRYNTNPSHKHLGRILYITCFTVLHAVWPCIILYVYLRAVEVSNLIGQKASIHFLYFCEANHTSTLTRSLERIVVPIATTDSFKKDLHGGGSTRSDR